MKTRRIIINNKFNHALACNILRRKMVIFQIIKMLMGKHNCIEKSIVKSVFKYTNLSFNEDIYDWSNYNIYLDEVRCDYQNTCIGFDIVLDKLFYRKYEDEEFKFNIIHFSINYVTKIAIVKSSDGPTPIFYHKIIIRVELRGNFCQRSLFDFLFSFDFNNVIKRLKHDYKHAIEDMVGYVFSEFKKHCEFTTKNIKFDKYVEKKV